MTVPNLKAYLNVKMPLDIPPNGAKISLISCHNLIIDENQPFRLYTGEQLAELAERIKRSGLLNPIIVRPVDMGMYEVLSGRNRAKAVMLNGDEEIEAIIRDVDDDMAAIIMIDANLGQRETLFPSEKAKAYKMEVDILNRRGKRPDESLVNGCSNFDARFLIGKKHNESKTSITNYIRLTHLIPELLELVDEKKLQFTAGVELSYLSENEQRFIFDEYVSNGVKPSAEQLKSLKNLSKEERLDDEAISGILSQKTKSDGIIKLRKKNFSQYSDIIGNMENIEQFFLEFLESYKRVSVEEKF